MTLDQKLAQFSGPELRNHFNLISYDQRGCGGTGGIVPKEGYTPACSADELWMFVVRLLASTGPRV